eukprot:NODE_913_length_3094_cov_1.653088.p2 type:complete len:276 gc:universal NODE_913_length_3094_cov_1.653088:585-1412(+)
MSLSWTEIDDDTALPSFTTEEKNGNFKAPLKKPSNLKHGKDKFEKVDKVQKEKEEFQKSLEEEIIKLSTDTSKESSISSSKSPPKEPLQGSPARENRNFRNRSNSRESGHNQRGRRHNRGRNNSHRGRGHSSPQQVTTGWTTRTFSDKHTSPIKESESNQVSSQSVPMISLQANGGIFNSVGIPLRRSDIDEKTLCQDLGELRLGKSREAIQLKEFISESNEIKVVPLYIIDKSDPAVKDLKTGWHFVNLTIDNRVPITEGVSTNLSSIGNQNKK